MTTSVEEMVLIQLGLATERLAQLHPAKINAAMLSDDRGPVTAVGALERIEHELRQIRRKLIEQQEREVA
jgi:hypothetical protein